MSVNYCAYMVYGFHVKHAEIPSRVTRYNEITGEAYDKFVIDKKFVCTETKEVLNVESDDIFGFDFPAGVPIGSYESDEIILGVRLFEVDDDDPIRTITDKSQLQEKFQEWVSKNMKSRPKLETHLVMYCSF